MLEKARGRASPLMARVGRLLARVIPDPDFYTFAGAALAWFAVVAASLEPVYAPAVIVLSALLDAVDGAVARAVGRVSRRGEFLDSTLDRVADAGYFYTLYILGVDPGALLVAGMLAVTISYVRAKGELVGVELRGVGFMERGDRVAALTLASLLASQGYLVAADAVAWGMAGLSALTVAMRAGRVLSRLPG